MFSHQRFISLFFLAGYFFGIHETVSGQDTKLKFDSSHLYRYWGNREVLAERTLRQYNAAGALTSEEIYSRNDDTGNFKLDLRISMFYDEKGLLKEKFTEWKKITVNIYNPNWHWDSTGRETYFYKENRLIARVINKQYTNQKNKQETRTGQETLIYTHDNSGNITSETNELFVDEQWKVISQKIHTYFPDNRIKNTADGFSLMTHLYDKNGKLTAVVAERLNKLFGKDQGHLYKSEYFYHPNGDLKREVRKIFLTYSAPRVTFFDAMRAYHPKQIHSQSTTSITYTPAYFDNVIGTGKMKIFQNWDTEYEIEYLFNTNKQPEIICTDMAYSNRQGSWDVNDREKRIFNERIKTIYTYNPDHSVNSETAFDIHDNVKSEKIFSKQIGSLKWKRLYFY